MSLFKHRWIFALCAMAGATTAQATTALAPGLYTLSFNRGAQSTSEPVTLNGTGTARTIVVNSASGAQTIPTTVTPAGVFHGATTAHAITMVLDGHAAATTASGTFTATSNGKSANGTFTLAPRSATVARMRSRDGEQDGTDYYERIIVWLLSLLGIAE